jgi:surfeit locus 1 family protein
MLSAMRRAGLIVPSVFALAALALLIGLGNWQWRRMQWKEALIAHLQSAARTKPVDLTATDVASTAAGRRYTAITITGRFRHDQEVYVFWTRANTPGYLVLTPLEPAGRRAIFVNRGFVPARLKAPASRPKGQPDGEVTVRGLLVRRAGTNGLFTPHPDKAKRIWYAIDPTGIAAALGLDVVRDYTVDADDRPNPGGWPQGLSIAARIAQIPNRHLEYALTWWALALTLICVFAAFAYSRLRRLGQSSK